MVKEMKNTNLQKIRSLLRGGAKAIALISLLLVLVSCSHGGKKDTDNYSSKSEVTTTCTTFTTTFTGTTSTTSSMTTTTETTTTMVETTLMTPPILTSQTIVVQIEEQPTHIEPVTESTYTQSDNNLPITDYERTLLRNVVANEYGSDTHGYGGAPVTPYERACVVATVMNRVNSPKFPNTIEEVLTQPSQFSGYYACNYEWNTVTDNVRAGVDYYFDHPDEFGNWLYFEGDGRYNYFR